MPKLSQGRTPWRLGCLRQGGLVRSSNHFNSGPNWANPIVMSVMCVLANVSIFLLSFWKRIKNNRSLDFLNVSPWAWQHHVPSNYILAVWLNTSALQPWRESVASGAAVRKAKSCLRMHRLVSRQHNSWQPWRWFPAGFLHCWDPAKRTSKDLNGRIGVYTAFSNSF